MANARRFRLLAKVFSSLLFHPPPSEKGRKDGEEGDRKDERGRRERKKKRRRRREQPTTIQLRKPSCPPPLFFYSLYFPPFATLFPFIPVPSAKLLRTSSKEFSPSLSPSFPFIPRGKIDLSAAKVVSSFPMRKRNESGASFSLLRGRRRMINTFRFSFVLHFWLRRIKRGLDLSTCREQILVCVAACY